MREILIISLFSTLLCACMSATIPQPQLYTLNPTTIPIKKARNTAKTLFVLNTEAVSTFNRKDMAYVLGQHKIAYYAKNLWVIPPAQQLTPLIVTALQQSHHYKGVVTAPYIGITDLRLATSLVKLEQIFNKGGSHVIMQLSASLTNVTTGKLIASQQFKVKIPAPLNNPYGGVVAANQATSVLIQRLVLFCIKNT